MCDASGNGEISKKEAFECIKEHVPPEHHQEAKDMIDQMWPMIDTSGNGEVSAKEIEDFIKKSQRQPSAADIIEMCDTSENGQSKKEVKACIKEHVPPEHQKEVDQMVDDVWPMVDTDGSGEIDEHELAAAMRRGDGPSSLAKKGGDGPSPADIIDACDSNGSGGIDIEEAHACIDAHITDPEENK